MTWRQENPSRSAGCCRPLRRASHRSTGRHRRRSRCSARPGQQPQPQILRDIGVLIFVDQHVLERPLIVGEHVGIAPGTAAGIRAADRRNRRHSAASGAPGTAIELAALAVGKGMRPRRPAPWPATGRGSSSRRSAPASCRAGQRFSSMSSASRTCFSSRIWSSVSRMVKSVLEADQLGMAAQDLDADRMEGAEPCHALDHAADQQRRCGPSSRGRPCW